jgi:predicted phage-related endonuclease
MVAQAIPVIQGTPEWIDARRDVVGSSDIPIITGSSPYATSVFALWAAKTRLVELEPPDPETQELFDLGHALEEPIADRYTVITGRPLRRRRQLLVHPTRPVDGRVARPRVRAEG